MKMETVKHETALTAMCVWEWYIENYARDKNSDCRAPMEAWRDLMNFEQLGTAEVRDVVLNSIAPAIENIWKRIDSCHVLQTALANADLDAFDWEFIPAYMAAMVELDIQPYDLFRPKNQDAILQEMGILPSVKQYEIDRTWRSMPPLSVQGFAVYARQTDGTARHISDWKIHRLAANEAHQLASRDSVPVLDTTHSDKVREITRK